MIIEIAIAVVAVAFAVLVGFLVPTLIQLKQTVAEAQRVLAHIDAELPALLKEARRVTENVSAVADQARDGVEHASSLLHAVGEVGDSVHKMHQAVRGKSLALMVKLASMVAGVKAASGVFSKRTHQEGGNTDGER